jgi:hypothetical protein
VLALAADVAAALRLSRKKALAHRLILSQRFSELLTFVAMP